MQVMEHLENVEEARFMVDEYMKTKTEEVGVKLDPENEQINDDCDMEEEISHPDFEHLDPKQYNLTILKNVKERKFSNLLTLAMLKNYVNRLSCLTSIRNT